MGMIDAPAVVVCDAGPLIHLDELRCTALLKDFQRVLIPAQVLGEVYTHRPDLAEQSDFRFESIEVALSTEPSFRALVTMFALDLGEQAALSLMQRFPQAIFLTDDAAARLAADSLGLRVHGTIGVLVRAIRRQQLSREEVLGLLHQIPERSSLHIKRSLLEEIISRL